jgi:uncharacterized GH25 family protein
MKHVDVREGETTVNDLDEASKINVTGRVVKGGQPVANAMILFSAGDGGGMPSDLRQSRTDTDGHYQIGLDTAGTYSVIASSLGGMFGGGRSVVRVEVPDQPNPVVDITLKSAGVSGHVMNVEGKPVSGAIVTLTTTGAPAASEGRRLGGLDAQSEPDGSFLIDGVTQGTYGVTAAASGYRNANAPPVTIANDNDVATGDIHLEPGRTVRGRVVDQNGNGIAGAMVLIASSGASPSGRDGLSATSDVNGTFVITAPADGPIDLTAVADGFPPARGVSVQPEDGVDVVLHAPRPGHVRVTVVDSGGRPVTEAKVTCHAVPDFLGAGYAAYLEHTPSTGGDGVTTVTSLAPGSYELNVSKGSKNATQAVTLAEGGDSVTTVTLP